MRIKVKSPTATKVLTIDDDLTYSEFIHELTYNQDLFPEPETITALKKGFPPKPIGFQDNKSIKEDISNGDQLIVETGASPHSGGVKENENVASTGPKEKSSEKNDIPNVEIPELNQYLILRNIPDDNSCMFNAINYAMKKESVEELRAICAAMIRSDPDKYSDIVLGKTNSDYSDWIKKPNSWGGAIELGILSAYLNVRITCIDIESGNPIIFEDETVKPNRFIYLIYSGIHYDLLVLNRNLSVSDSDKAKDETMWELNGEKALLIDNYSQVLVGYLQSSNYITNTTSFRLRCLICYKILVGETGASKHANDTGHFKFGEVESS